MSADDVRRAAAAFDRGRDAYRVESYVEAAEHFEAADAYAPSAASLRLAILSRQSAGQLDRALTLSALALNLYPEDAALGELARGLIQENESSLGRVEIECSEPCDLLLDNKIVHGRKSLNRTLYLQAGVHSLRATWSKDRVQSEQVTVQEGESQKLVFQAPEIPVEPPPVVEPKPDPIITPSEGSASVDTSSGGWSPIIFWTGVGVTAAGIGASTFLGVRALNEPGADAVRDACRAGQSDCQSLYDQGVQNQNLANIAIGATAAVGVFTIISGIWLTDWSSDSKPENPLAVRHGDFSLTPNFSVGGGASVGATGTF